MNYAILFGIIMVILTIYVLNVKETFSGIVNPITICNNKCEACKTNPSDTASCEACAKCKK